MTNRIKQWSMNPLFFCLIIIIHRDESENYMKRQSDIYEQTYKEDLTSIQRNQRYRAVHGNAMKPR